MRNWKGVDRRAGLCQKRGMDETLVKTLSEGAAAIGVRLGPAELDFFAAYHREISSGTGGSISSRNALPRRSSSAIFSIPDAGAVLDHPGGALIDLGSGGGFPGIPVADCSAGSASVLIGGLPEKSSFLSHLLRTLRLGGVQVVRERVEKLTAGEALAAASIRSSPGPPSSSRI